MPVEPGRVKEIFLGVVDLPTPGERAAYLDEACGGDLLLRRRLEALLKSNDRSNPLLDRPAADHLATTLKPRRDVESSNPTPPADEVLALLGPAQRPGSLGRLGHYEVLEVLGRGGMGVVFRAFDEKLHRVVAIKVLAGHLASNGAARQRFVREARAAAAVTHENVVDIHAVEDDGPVPYLVMQCIAGPTLQKKLDSSGPLGVGEILRIGLQIAEGLAAAHRQGLIHRDIKPANVLLENGIERARLMDFGLARAADDASLTQSGYVAGTPLYMSPEQARGEPVDYRTDLFSLGGVLYARCTGHTPFRAESTLAVLMRVCEDTPRPIREVNPAIPASLEAVIARLLAKDSAARFQTAAEVAAVLSRLLAEVQAGRNPADLGIPAEAIVHGPRGTPSSPRRSFRWLRWAALGLLLASALLVGWTWWKNQSDDQPGRNGEGGTTSPGPAPWQPRPPLSPKELARLPNPLDGRKREDIPRRLLELAGGGDPEQAPPALVAVLGDGGPLIGVAVSPDGRFVAGGGNDRLVRLWDLAGWKADLELPPCRLLSGHAGTVWSVAFSPDGRSLASGSFDGTIILWDVTTGKKVSDLTGHSRRHSLIRFSPDGQTLAAGTEDGIVNRWDLATGQRKEPLRLHAGIVRAAAYSPDGLLLASAGEDGTLQLVEAATGRRRQLFRGEKKLTDVVFSPDGRVVAVTCDGPGPSIRTWDVASGQELPALSGHTSHAGSLAFHPGGRLLASGSWDGTARVWDRTTGAVKVLPVGIDPASQCVSVAWSREGRYLAAVRENRLACLFRLPPPAAE